MTGRTTLFLFGFLLVFSENIAQPQDSLMGYATLAEAYIGISKKQKRGEPDQDFSEPLAAEIIQKEVLAEGQALLEYFVAEDKICVFYFAENAFHKQLIPIDKSFVRQVEGLKKSLTNPDFTSEDFLIKNEVFVKSAFAIYQKIVAPLEKFNLPERLLIKPDGLLKDLPFGVLLTKLPTDFLDYENHAYLIKKHQISYCHSTENHRDRRMHKNSPTKRFLTFAPNTNDYLEEEATLVYRKFGGEMHQGAAAWETILEEKTPAFAALHFPELCASDLARLPSLQADLVVFSTCPNEPKNLPKTELLLQKNAKAVVTNLWETNKDNHFDFLKNFYHKIYQKKAKDAALQEAKLDAFNWTQTTEGHPHFWAGYVLFGMSEEVDLQGFRFDLWFFGALVFMLFLGTVFANKGVI